MYIGAQITKSFIYKTFTLAFLTLYLKFVRKMNFLTRKTSRLTLICTMMLASLASCTKDVEYIKENIPEVSNIRVIVGNEGNLASGGASLTAITYDNFVKNDLFRTVNNRPLGDIGQSITEIGDNLYVTLNNSRKVEVLNKNTFVSVETILTADATIPTYIADLHNDSIAISEKGSGRLMIVNINQMGVKDVKRNMRIIPSIGSTNQMKVVDKKLFLAGSTLRVLDINNLHTEKMRKIDGVSVVGDSKIVLDKNGNLWVLTSKSLVCINPKTEAIVKTCTFKGVSIDAWGGRLDISPNGEYLYLTGKVDNIGGILKMSINDTETPTKLLFPHTGVRTLYCMSVSPEETIFIADVLFGSLARGLIHEYSKEGKLLCTSEAGIFPSYFHFTKAR